MLSGKTAKNKRRKRWRGEGKAADWVDESNGIVEQNQWIRSTKSMELFNDYNGFVS
jgi:hypothetical protein